MPDSLTDLIANVGAYQSGANAATQQIVALTQSQAALSQADSKVYAQVATDQSTVTAAAQAAALRTQADKIKAANAFHTNLSDVSEQITLYAAAADAAQATKDEALAEIARKDSVTLFDNPIEYIMNQFTVGGDIAKHNAANAQLESANARIQTMNANTQTTVQTQNAISEPLTAASAEAATRIAAAAATVEANKAAAQGLSYNVAGIQAALNNSKESLRLQFDVNGARNTERQIGISLEHLSLAKQEFAQKQKEYAERDADKHEQQAYGQSVVDTINRGRVAILGAGSELDDVNGKMVLAALRGKNPLSAQMQKFLDAGELAKATGINMFGASPSAAASTLASIPAAQLNPTQLPVKQLLSASASIVGTAMNPNALPGKNPNPALMGLNPKDPASVAAAMDAVSKQTLATYAAEVKPGDATNPYQIPSINSLGANSPTVAALPVYQKVFAPLIKQGVQLTDPKQIMNYVGDAVAKGVITHAEAVELSTVYHVGVKTNLAMRNLPGFGLTPSLSYNASVEVAPGSFNENQIVDLTKPDAISRALIKRQSSVLSVKLLPAVNKMIGNSFLHAIDAGIDGAGSAGSSLNRSFDSMFAPQPAAADALSTKVNEITAGLDTAVANGLPKKAPATQQAVRGSIKY
jgi:hypothetical protein